MTSEGVKGIAQVHGREGGDGGGGTASHMQAQGLGVSVGRGPGGGRGHRHVEHMEGRGLDGWD